MHSEQLLKHDDFEELLVREVIEENPPEDVGIRPEWRYHSGWHRKEYVHLRGDQKQRANGTASDSKHKIMREHDIMASYLWGSAAVMVLVVITILRVRTMRQKTRMQ